MLRRFISIPSHCLAPTIRRSFVYIMGIFIIGFSCAFCSVSLRIVLLLTTYDLADDKFDFAPVQSPNMRSSRRKRILVQGDESQKLNVKFLFWVEGAIL